MYMSELRECANTYKCGLRKRYHPTVTCVSYCRSFIFLFIDETNG